MTTAQRQQRCRAKLRALCPAIPRLRELLALDPGAIASRIMMSMPPEKVDRLVAALNQRVVHWGVATFDPRYPYVTGGGARP